MNVVELDSKRQARGRDTRQVILTDDVEAGIDEAIEALVDHRAGVYQRGGMLVQVTSDLAIKDGLESVQSTPKLAPVGPARLVEMLSSSAVWMRTTKKEGGAEKDVRCLPPLWLVRGVLERGEWPHMRRVSSVTEVPVLRADGSILSRPGYDPATELIYRPTRAFAIPEKATKDDALAARDVLLDAVCDFPFASDAHKAGWLACVLTGFARRAFDGPSPFFAFDANTRGSGKSLLADLATRIVCGRAVAREPQADDPSEERKRITSHAIAGDRVVFIDNVRGQVGTSALESAVTSTRWKDRVLGQSGQWEGEFAPLWVATGNNMEFSGDMCRRVCHVRIESQEENPEEREGFKHPMLLEWADAELPSLVRAALTILRAYFQAGVPQQEVRNWGSFEGWNRVVAGSVVWAGLPDPNETRQDLTDAADEERRTIGEFLRVFREHATWGSSAKGIIDDAEHNKSLREALVGFCPGQRGEPPSAKSLGKRLAASKGRNVGGMQLIADGEDRNGTIKWRVREVKS